MLALLIDGSSVFPKADHYGYAGPEQLSQISKLADSAPIVEFAMLPSGQIDREGVTTFSDQHEILAFRYRLTVVKDKLQIWLQQRSSKQEWQSEPLGVCDFALPDATLPEVTLGSYVNFFVECLRADQNTELPLFQRSIFVDPDGVRTLCLVLLTKFLNEYTRFEYEFPLKPVDMNPLNVLAARIRDLEEENEQLKKCELALARFMTDDVVPVGAAHKWKCTGKLNAAFGLLDDGAVVTFVKGGVYLVNLHLSHCKGARHEIELNQIVDRTRSSSNADDGHATLTFPVQVNDGGTLRIVNRSSYVAGNKSILMIVAL